MAPPDWRSWRARRRRRQALMVGLAVACAARAAAAEPQGPIRIGVIHSLTGTMKISETPLVSALQLAVAEVNAAGGVRGRTIEPIIVDIQSDEGVAAREAERLLTEERIVSLFGCWTSACRQAVLPVLKRHRGLLWYPVQYEGREDRQYLPYVIYTGAAPNQQIVPALDWAIAEFGARVFLVGSDYVFPRTANDIIRERMAGRKGAIVGEEYLPLGATDVSGVVSKIVAAHPDVVINTINGDANESFFVELTRATGKRRIPTLSFSIAENEIREIGTKLLQGNYLAWNYFQSLDTPENRAFVAAFRERFGQNAVTSDPIEASYFQVLAFAEAASDAPEITPDAIRKAALGLSMVTPGGIVRIDAHWQHLWKMVRIGEVMADGQIRVKRDSVVPVEPNPYPKGDDRGPPLWPPEARADLTSPVSFRDALPDPASTPRIAQALREITSLPWSADDRSRALLAAAASPSFLVRYEAARAAERLPAPRRDVIATLLGSDDPFDAVSAMRLLALEEAVNDGLAARAVALLGHGSRRVRLAAGAALLAQGSRGWRAGPDATSRIIAGFDDTDLGVERNALALSAFSKEFASRVLPILAKLDVRATPSFFRGSICRAVAEALRDRVAMLAEAGRGEARQDFKDATVEIERGDCLPAAEVAALRDAIARATPGDDHGPLYRIAELFRGNVGIGIAVSLVLALALFELFGLLLALVILVLAPARLIDLLRGMSPLDSDRLRLKLWSFEARLFAFFSPTWLKGSRRALRVWADANLNHYRDAFARSPTVQLRQTHVPLPAIFPPHTGAVKPAPAEIRPLVEGGRLRLQITGEGGTGKTSLACQMGRWAMAADHNDRIGRSIGRRAARRCLIAVMFEPGEPLDATPASFLAALQRKLMFDGRPLPLWLCRELVEGGFVLAVFDDVSEIAGITATVLAAPELAGLWVIATSRVDLPAEFGAFRTVHPQKLRGRILTEFFLSYPLLAGHADKMGDHDVERYVTEFKQLLGEDESRQETVVYFARLFLDYRLGLQSEDEPSEADLHQRRPQSVPELVESFVDWTCRHAAKRHGLKPIEVVGLIRRVAYLAIAGRQRPGPLPLADLGSQAEGLKRELGIPPEVDLEELLVASGLLDRPNPYHLRFKIDLVHEYCAVFDVRDRAADCPTRAATTQLWKSWVDEIGAAADLDRRSSGLLNATYECLRSDRVAADAPRDLIATVANLLGRPRDDLQPIRIGILHSLQGTMAMSEIGLHDAALLAVEEINEAGGVAGRRLEAIVRDGASDLETFARQAQRLVREDGALSIFGCWTSATRKRVMSVVEAERSLLWYPVQYEGYEKSEAIIYTGAAPNQQIIPAVDWCLGSLLPERGVAPDRARIYLVGSDYVFPRRANAIVRRRLRDRGIEPVAERYAALGGADFREIAGEIERQKPHVVINTINGSSNIRFFAELEERGIRAAECPVISLSVAEAEVRDIGARRLRGHYAVWNYFQSLPGDANRQFVSAFQQKYGLGRVTSDPMATAYAQIKIFAEAARHAGVLTREELRKQLGAVDIATPVGRIRFDQASGHFSKHVYVGRVNEEGQFDVIGQLGEKGAFEPPAPDSAGWLLPPNPFPFPELLDSFTTDAG